MTADLAKCPSCGSANLGRHCGQPAPGVAFGLVGESRTCTWVACRRCGGYGDRDGRRWVPGSRYR